MGSNLLYISQGFHRLFFLYIHYFTFCLFQIFPLRGPVEGGTLLTVQGRNLGRRAAAVKVSIGDVPCTLMPELYNVSVE